MVVKVVETIKVDAIVRVTVVVFVTAEAVVVYVDGGGVAVTKI